MSLRNHVINNMLTQMNSKESNDEMPMPSEETIKHCKQLANNFLDTLNNIKRLKIAVRDQMNKKNKYESEILDIMSIYGFEELKDDIKQIKLKLNTSSTHEPLTSNKIKQRLEQIKDIHLKSIEEIENEVFKREKSEKICLKKLKNTPRNKT